MNSNNFPTEGTQVKKNAINNQITQPIGIVEECVEIAFPKAEAETKAHIDDSSWNKEGIFLKISKSTLWKYMKEKHGLKEPLTLEEKKKLLGLSETIKTMLLVKINTGLILDNQEKIVPNNIQEKEDKIKDEIDALQKEGVNIAYLRELKETVRPILKEIINKFQNNSDDTDRYFYPEADKLWKKYLSVRKAFGMQRKMYNLVLTLVELEDGRHIPRDHERWRDRKDKTHK